MLTLFRRCRLLAFTCPTHVRRRYVDAEQTTQRGWRHVEQRCQKATVRWRHLGLIEETSCRKSSIAVATPSVWPYFIGAFLEW